MKKIAIFASGTGSNAERLIQHFSQSDVARVELLVSNVPDCGAVQKAKQHQVNVLIYDNAAFRDQGEMIAAELKSQQIDLIVLAGFLRMIPQALIRDFGKRMLNVHPALLPKFGGKGMYGMRVHEAVIAAGEKESGISIHRVTEHYDEGDILFQAKCSINEQDTAESLAIKIHDLEHLHFPLVVEKFVAQC